MKIVVADSKPFSTTGAHFADAKFYLESAFVEDVQSLLVEMKQSKYNEKNLTSSNSEKNEISQGLKV